MITGQLKNSIAVRGDEQEHVEQMMKGTIKKVHGRIDDMLMEYFLAYYLLGKGEAKAKEKLEKQEG